MTAPASQLTEQLCAAIHAQKLGENAGLLAAQATNLSSDDTQLLDAAQRVCGRIREQMIEQAKGLVARLQQAGIPCRFEAEEPQLLTPQFHRYSLLLDVENPTPAIEILNQQGFWSPQSTRDVYWESYRRSRSEMALTCIDDASTRLDLRWRDPQSKTPWRPDPVFLLRNPVRCARAVLRRVGQVVKPALISSQPSLGDLLSTPRSLLPQLLDFAGISGNDLLLDVGCGDGRVLIEAARLTGCRGIGFEMQPELCKIATSAVRRERLQDRIVIHHGDAWSAPLFDATVVFLFIPVQSLSSFLPQLLDRLPPGSRIVAHEQVPLDRSLKPDQSMPLIGEAAITVAHLWRVG
ncbi:MAG: class I SAM-dependent methyltransferase [Motiliproteus sp.]